jgi:CO/xanthine dehydrogenase FAD-binding subunit
MLVYREGKATADIAAADFFTGPMMTALPPAGCLTAVRFPVWGDQRIGVGFHEVSARRSDFAFVSAAAQIVLNNDGVCRRLAVGIGGATSLPLKLTTVGEALTGERVSASVARDAVNAALADIEPLADLHASADYRRRVAATLAVRAIADACEAASAGSTHAN